MQWLSILLFTSTIVLIVGIVTQEDTERMTSGNNITSAHDNILDIQIAVANVGRIKYLDGDVVIFQNKLSSSDFFFTPFPYVEPNLTECNYDELNGHNELILVVSLYTSNLLELVENYIKKKFQDICQIKECEVALLPMHSIRLFQKGPRTTESRNKYNVDSGWHSNTQLRQMIEFIIYTSNMSICENLKKSIISRCFFSNFEVQYSLHSQKTIARTLEVTTEHVTNTSMYNKIKSQLSPNNHDTVALTGNDYKNLLSETLDQITMNIRVEEGYESIQDSFDIDRLLDRQLQYKQVQLTKFDDNIWNSLYWTPELTRPDRLSKALKKIIKQDATDTDKFRFDYSQADETLKQDLKLYDKQKLDNLEKELTTSIANRSEHRIPLNNDVLHFTIDGNRYTDTNDERKNGTTIILQRNEAEKLVQYLSEHVEIEGDIIKPRPIDVTIIKFGSLKSYTRLFSSTVHVKTQMRVHALPLRCPYKHRHRSSAIWLEESHNRLSNVVNELENKLIINLTETMRHYRQYDNQTSYNTAHILKLMNSSINSLKTQLVEKITETESTTINKMTSRFESKLNGIDLLIEYFGSLENDAMFCSSLCLNGGTCTGPNSCTCPKLWTGLRCETPVCLSSCLNDGTCTRPNSCTCTESWTGSRCETPVCAPSCLNGGTCTRPNFCTCLSSWTGLQCETSICSSACLNGGTCTGPNSCTCTESWRGPRCERNIPSIPANATWKSYGVTVAGGNGKGSATNQLYWPYGLFVDDNQTVIIADFGNHRIVQWKKDDTNGRVIAGGNGQGNRLDQLDRPTDVLIDKETDSLIIADWKNRRVVRWSRRYGTKQIEILIDNIDCWGLAMDDQRYLYVSDVETNEVRRYRLGDTNGTLVAGGNDGGDGLNQLKYPRYLFVDQQQNLYVSDYNNNRVMKWNKGEKEGIVVAGGNAKGNALTQLHYPNGIFVDIFGTLYVADNMNHRVMRWSQGDTQGTVIAGVWGQGGGAYELRNPLDLSFDHHGNLYVVDYANYRVQRFDIIK